MTKSRAPAPRIPPIVTEIGRKAEIRSLNLVRGTCEVVSTLPQGERVADLRIALRGGGDRHKNLEQTIVCGFGVNVEAVGPAPDTLVVAKFSCDYAVQYHFEDKAYFEKLEPADIIQFAAYNASMHVWPHVREFVQSMAFRMTIPPVLLPMFRPLDMIGPVESWQAANPGATAKPS